MKRLLIAAGVAGLSLSAVAAQAGRPCFRPSDQFRIRYSVQYSGGAYLGYPSTTRYSVNYIPQIGQGQGGDGYQTVDADGQPVYPRHLGPGYTVNGYPGPYTSYKYDFRQRYHYQYPDGQGSSGGCNHCNAGSGPTSMTVENRLQSGGQTSRQYSAPMPVGPTYQGPPVQQAPAAEGVIVPSPAAPSASQVQPEPKTTLPKTARGRARGTPVLVSDEHETGR